MQMACGELAERRTDPSFVRAGRSVCATGQTDPVRKSAAPVWLDGCGAARFGGALLG